MKLNNWTNSRGGSCIPRYAVVYSLYRWTTEYDMIQYDMVYLRALKSSQDGQLNLAHGTDTEK